MTRHPAPAAAPIAVAALLALAGCGAADATTTSTAGAAPASADLRVGLLEWQIATSSAALSAGVDRLTVTNTGATAHDLHVSGPGLHAHTPLLAPGGTATLTLTTRAGITLTLSCEVTGHEEAGMHTTLRVIP